VKEEKMSVFPTKILLATDGSEYANLALHVAVDMAEKTGSELHVVHVGTPVYLPRYYEGLDMEEYIEEEEQGLERRAQKLLDEQVGKINATGGSVDQAHLRIGGPDEEIVTLAEELGAGLIVMGSRGLGGVRRALIGSVSDSVVRHAHCPVLVVRKESSDK
jgi:nucleotide-binding universal stress UspA family protein